MKRIMSLMLLSMFMVFGIGISANAQSLPSPSFENGFFCCGWSQGRSGAQIITSQDSTPNIAPTDGTFMLNVASTNELGGGRYGPVASLATDELINTGIIETNVSWATHSTFGESVPSYLSYDVSFLAPTDNTCDNYAAVLLLHINEPGTEDISIADANCYNSTGNGFINTENGPVSCIQVTDDNVPYSIVPTPTIDHDFAGRSNFFTDSLPVPVPDNDNEYFLHLVSGQIFDGVCNLDPQDTGALFDNFNLLTLNLDPLDPSEAGVLNTFSADGFTPNGDVVFIFSFGLTAASQLGAEVSTRVAPDDICQGLDTPLNNPRILRTVQADGNGDASFNLNIPQSVAGATVHLQAVDITSCNGSNVNTETIGDPPGAQPPVLLALNPGSAGQQNTLSATGATPNSDVRFIWSFNQGNVTANNICPGFQSGIINPRTLPIVQSNGAGTANLNVNVPANLAGVSLVLQAVDIATCTGSNVNPETL